MKCENCKNGPATKHTSGFYYCAACLKIITKKVTDLSHLFDVIRDERMLDDVKPERFGGCISSCESVGHNRCICGLYK